MSVPFGKATPAETLERLRKEAKRRLKAFRNGDERAIRWFRRAIPDAPADPSLRDMQLAVARSLDFPGWADLKRALETPPPEPQSNAGIVSRFLDNACPDHHVRGRQDHRRAEWTAMRLLEQHPEIAHHDINTAIVCGDIDFVRAAIARDPRLAVVATEGPSAVRAMAGGANDLYGNLGAKGWTPLLHLAFTRLPIRASNDNAVEIARLLLDSGADPNAFFHAGDSHYTPMTGVAGEGEEDRPAHPRRDELTQLFLDHGANPYDIQVVYDLGFHAEYLWWLPMIYAHAVQTGRADDWRDPEWKMLDMGGYGCGARWFLDRAIREGKVDLAAWCLEHGAGPNVPPARDKRMLQTSLYEGAIRAGQLEIAELLLGHGAQRVSVTATPLQSLTDAAFRLDRSRVDAILREHPELRSSPQPLFRAADLNRGDVIHLLVDAGFSPNVADDKNTRPLNHVAWSDAVDAARALVDRGAEIDSVEENYGGTAFGNAAHFLHRKVMDFLAPLTKDVWNLTYNGYLDRLREVLAEDPRRARVDWDTWSPLLWLPPHDEDVALATVKLFVHHGADPHRRDSNGVAPVDRAEALGMTRVVAYLRSLPPNEAGQ
jgi:ankyrin repeat protein